MLEKIQDTFKESIQIQIAATEELPDRINYAAQKIIMSILNDGKVLCCGMGNSAVSAEQFATCLLNHFETERPSLPAISLHSNTTLTAIANNGQFDDIFSKQIRAIGQAGDVLLACTSSGNTPSIIKAIEAAMGRDMVIIALTGNDGGIINGLLGEADVEIRVPSNRTPRIQELHLLTIHCLCDIIDHTLFPPHPE